MNMNKKHALLMLACCLIPLIVVAAIFVFKVPVNSVVYLGMLLLCPALHLLMMRNMMGHHTDHGANADCPSHDHAGHSASAPDSPMSAQVPRSPVVEKKELRDC